VRLSSEYIFDIILPRLQTIGIDPTEILADARLSVDDVEETRGLFLDTHDIVESVERRVDNPFDFSRTAWPGPPPETPLNLLMASQPSLHSALLQFQEFSSSLVDDLRLELSSEAQGTRILFRSTNGACHPGIIEWWVASFASLLKQITEDHLTISNFSFRHPARAQTDPRAAGLTKAATFRGNFDGLVIGANDLELPLPRRSELIASTMKRLLREESQSRSRLHLARIEAKSRFILLSRLRLSQSTQISDIARDFGMSSRNYQRRLQQSGTSFRQIREDALVEFAKDFLTGTKDSIERISRRAGFSHKSAFHRAFKRATGKTPARFRLDHRRPPDPTGQRPHELETPKRSSTPDEGCESRPSTRPPRS